MEYVVFAVIGCEEAFPESVLCEKVLSLLVSLHERTPEESQKILVREPEGTDGGEAHISARSGPRYEGVLVACGTVGAEGIVGAVTTGGGGGVVE